MSDELGVHLGTYYSVFSKVSLFFSVLQALYRSRVEIVV